MDYSKNIKAFIQDFPVRKITGQEKFLILAAKCANGMANKEIKLSDIKKLWQKTLMGGNYNPSFYHRAQQKWINSLQKGTCEVVTDGLDYLATLAKTDQSNCSIINGVMNLLIFDKKNTHSIDKFLRQEFMAAKKEIYIADSWVDETIFDNILDVIPMNVKIQLLYGQIPSSKKTSFETRKNRFNIQWTNFIVKRYKDLHDRFFIIDNNGYIIGPSLKNAAENSPAIVVTLPLKESSILQKFFNRLWLLGK